MNVAALADFSVNLKVQWWVNTTETTVSGSISSVQEYVVQAFAEQGISIPYPVQEVRVAKNESYPTEASAAK